MIVQALVFYLFAAVVVAAGVMVISARNPVHSVLFLIVAFFNAAGLFVLMGAEHLTYLDYDLFDGIVNCNVIDGASEVFEICAGTENISGARDDYCASINLFG